jgi:hypothetical protein
LLSGHGWLREFGEVEVVKTEYYGAVRSLRVFYRDGPEAEFGITGRSWADVPLDAGTKKVLSGGVRILYDPEKLFHVAQAAAGA